MSESRQRPAAVVRSELVADLQSEGVLLVEDGNHGESRPRRHEFVDDGVAFVRAADMNGGGVDFSRTSHISGEARERIRKGIGMPGDVLLSHKGTVGKVSYVPIDAPPFVCSPQTTFYRSLDPDRLDQRYLYYFLQSPAFVAQLTSRKSETDMADYVSLTAQRQLRIVLPPVEEQRRIAGVLGALDDLASFSDKLATWVDEIAAARYKVAAREMPLVAASELGSWTMGQSPPGDSYNQDGFGTVFYQGVRDFGHRYPTPRVSCTAPTRIADQGDILVAVRAPVGAINVATERTAIGRGLAALKADLPSLSLRALTVDGEVWRTHRGTGTVFESINKRDLLALRVPYRYDLELDAELAVMDSAHRSLTEEVNDLRRTRDELLPLLMSGRVRVGEVS